MHCSLLKKPVYSTLQNPLAMLTLPGTILKFTSQKIINIANANLCFSGKGKISCDFYSNVASKVGNYVTVDSFVKAIHHGILIDAVFAIIKCTVL